MNSAWLKKIRTILMGVVLALGSFLFWAQDSLAAPGVEDRESAIVGPLDCSSLTAALSNPERLNATHMLCYVDRLLTLFGVILPGTVAVVMLLYSGFLFITSEGRPDVIKKAGDTGLYAVIGL